MHTLSGAELTAYSYHRHGLSHRVGLPRLMAGPAGDALREIGWIVSQHSLMIPNLKDRDSCKSQTTLMITRTIQDGLIDLPSQWVTSIAFG